MKLFVRRFALLRSMLVIAVFAGLPSVSAQQPRKPADPSSEFFDKGVIPELKIEIPEPELEKLRAENRAYVRCTIRENKNQTYQNVAIKLKGAAGSFRDFDDRPALTINVTKFERTQSFHGLNKFHLNNSVQDESYLHEWICADLFRSAGIPATRVTHARVWLNGRDVGFYVLKEGFDKAFLLRHFKDGDGNLYDGGFLQDIDADLEKDSGKGPDDHSDLKTLLQACHEPDDAERWRRIDELVDVDKFLTFMAMELMTGHWDGYTQSRNNYRIYFDPTSKKVQLFPHGMDQMFGDPNASILDYPPAILAITVMRNPEWRAAYRKKITELLPLFTPADKLMKRIDICAKRLRPVLAAMDPQRAIEHGERVRELKDRLVVRAENLVQQNEMPDPPEPKPPEFDENGRLQLVEWRTAAESDDATHEEVQLEGEKRAFSILCGPSGHCVASWRTRVLLPQGTYVLHAQVKTNDVKGLEEEKGKAAGIRISGSPRKNLLNGTSEWSPLEYEFTIEEEAREVEIVAELRASHGQAWFDAESLHIQRKQTEASATGP